jgi:Flp pilus assembly protein TadG
MMWQPSGMVPKPMRNPGIRNWFSDHRGNVAITFALAIIPVFGAMGIAVDYSMANSARTNMQASLDATGIALQRQMPLTQTQMDTIGSAFFLGNLGKSPLTNITVTFTPGTGTITLDSSGTYNTGLSSVLTLIGMPTSFPVGAHVQVQWGLGKVEVALALDNTGSMAQSGKLTQLKIAAKNLLTTLQNAATTAGDAKVAIIPFGTEVNIGTSYANATWLRWDLWDAANGSYGGGGGWGGGGWGGGGWGGGGGGGGTWSPANHNTWTGCVIDRDQSNDVLDTTPTNSISTQFPTEQCASSVTSMMPLSYNWTALNSKIDQMVADGNTNVTIGLVWGFHALSPTLPLTEGAAYGTANLSKYLIILTDGTNTQNRWSSDQSTIDARTALACTNIKNAGIKIYAIRVIDGNATLLQNCASSPSMYYDVQDASQLSGVFSAIGTVIANLHLSK